MSNVKSSSVDFFPLYCIVTLFSRKKEKHAAVWKALARVLYISSLLIFLLMSKFLSCHHDRYHLPPYMRTYPLQVGLSIKNSSLPTLKKGRISFSFFVQNLGTSGNLDIFKEIGAWIIFCKNRLFWGIFDDFSCKIAPFLHFSSFVKFS